MPRTRQGYVFFWKERKRWYARVTWTDAGGKRRNAYRAVENRTEGRLVLRQMLREIEGNDARALEAHRMTFASLAEIYAERKLVPAEYQGETKTRGLRSYRNLRGYLQTLTAHFGGKRIQAITWGDLESFREQRLSAPTRRGERRSVAIVNRELQLLRATLNYAKREGWITRNPFEAGEPLIRQADEVKRDRVLTAEEETRLLAVCTGAREHLRALVICALDTGLRKSGQLALLWSDISFDEGVLRIRATTTKTRKARAIGLTARLRIELERLREYSTGEADARVFNQRDMKQAFSTACRLAGIEDLRWHDLRHTCVTRLVEAGMPAQQIMKITGHTQMQTFLRYVSADDGAARRAASALDELAALRAEEELSAGVNEFVN